MTIIRLPGLVDAHVHMREPGYVHKEDFASGTRAALAGGVTTVLDMPNTDPPTSTPERLAEKAALATQKAVCDVGLFVGATNVDLDAFLPVAQRACGLKIYVNDTFGDLRIDDLASLRQLFISWADKASRVGGFRGVAPETAVRSSIGPIAVHAEELMVPACLSLASLYSVPLHVVHVSRRSEIEVIRRAKEMGVPVTCEVTPHHLFLTADDFRRLGNRADMRPRLATLDDVEALWNNLDFIDIFATDHAPHTLEEKSSETPPPGIPGVETMLPLLLTAVHEDRLTLEDITDRCVHGPQRIYGLPEQTETWVDVDIDAPIELSDEWAQTRVGWTAYSGMQVFGRVETVVLRGETVFDGGKVVAEPGTGKVLFGAGEFV